MADKPPTIGSDCTGYHCFMDKEHLKSAIAQLELKLSVAMNCIAAFKSREAELKNELNKSQGGWS